MKLLDIREKTHGKWRDFGALVQWLKDGCRYEETFYNLTVQQREAVDMILHKVSRIVCGSPRVKDHWDDLAGYAALGARDADPEPTSPKDGKVVVKVSKPNRTRKGRRKTP